MRNGGISAVTLPLSGTARVAEPSKQRRVLTFSPNLTANYTVSTDPAVTDNAGLVVTAGGGCVTLTYEQVGALVQQAWYAHNATAGAIVVGVLQAFEFPT